MKNTDDALLPILGRRLVHPYVQRYVIFANGYLDAFPAFSWWTPLSPPR